MKLCSKCNRIVTPQSICDDAQCPIEGIQRSPVASGDSPTDETPAEVVEVAAEAAEEAPPSVAPPAVTAGLRFCPTCGTGYPAGERFCMHDGTPLPVGSPVPGAEEAAPADRPATVDAIAEPIAEEPPPPEPVSEVPEAEAEAEVAVPEELPAEVPVPASPEPAPPVTEVAPEDLACPVCGLSFEPGVRFCDRDGARLVPKAEAEAALATAAPPVGVEPEEAAWEDDWDSAEYAAPKRNYLVPGLLAVAVLLAGGGYAYWAGYLAPWLGGDAQSDLASAADAADDDRPVPGLLGNYTAHLADQDISLMVTADRPQALVSASAIVTYLNVVTGNTCTASLIPVSGGGVGGDTSNAVSFRQEPVADKPACPRDIPVRMEIVTVPEGSDGIVGSVNVEWLSPSNDEVLMSGTLQRETN